MGILFGLIVLIFAVFFILKQINSDGITGNKIGKYLLYIFLLISLLIIFLIINNLN